MRPLSASTRFFYVLGGVLVPAACFAVAAADPGPWPRDKQAGWRAFVLLLFHHEANWGLGLLLLASAAALCVAILSPKPASWLVRVLVAGGAVVSVTYLVFGALSELGGLFLASDLAAVVLWLVFSRVLETRAAPAALVLTVFAAVAIASFVLYTLAFDEGLPFLIALAGGPAWSLLAYASLWRRLRAWPLPPGPLVSWFAAYGAAIAYAFVQASRLYRELPEHAGCYVATAAARGHRRLVGPWPSAQLLWLKRGELVLAELAPRLHRLLRSAYDRVGPPVAACLGHPVAADLAYLSLKPAEWAVRAAFRIWMGGGAGERREAHRFPRED